MSLIMNELLGMTYISSSMLMTITKKKSTHSESSIFEVSLVWNICPKNENDFHLAHKHGDQNTNIPCDKIKDNASISEYAKNLK